MTAQPNESVRKVEYTAAPRVSLAGARLHFVTHRKVGPRQSPRLRLTGGLVGGR